MKYFFRLFPIQNKLHLFINTDSLTKIQQEEVSSLKMKLLSVLIELIKATFTHYLEIGLAINMKKNYKIKDN